MESPPFLDSEANMKESEGKIDEAASLVQEVQARQDSCGRKLTGKKISEKMLGEWEVFT